MKKRVTLYAADVRNMIELAFEICGEKYDIVSRVSLKRSGELSWLSPQAIQMCALLLCFMYTGARPGSLLKTAHWPNDYLRWKASRTPDDLHSRHLWLTAVTGHIVSDGPRRGGGVAGLRCSPHPYIVQRVSR